MSSSSPATAFAHCIFQERSCWSNDDRIDRDDTATETVKYMNLRQQNSDAACTKCKIEL